MANHYNGSLAYDLSVFESNEKQMAKKQELKVVKTPKQFLASALTLKNLALYLIAVTAIVVHLYNSAEQNKVTGEYSVLAAELRELENEYVKLESEANALLNPRVIAEYAENELGLRKADKYQTEYIYLYHDNKIEVTEPVESEGVGAKIKSVFNSAVNTIKEYIAAI